MGVKLTLFDAVRNYTRLPTLPLQKKLEHYRTGQVILKKFVYLQFCVFLYVLERSDRFQSTTVLLQSTKPF